MTEGTTKRELLERLAEDASYFRPELFAVYGVDRGGQPFLGWGMQWGDTEAVYYQPDRNSTWLSTSAEHVLRGQQRIGEAHLKWLND